MNRSTKPAGKSRLAAIAGAIAVFAVAWFMLSGPDRELVESRSMEGTVVEISRRDRTVETDSADAKVVMVLVQLADGGRSRILLPTERARIDARVALRVSIYSDGSRRVVPQPAD